MSILKKYLIFLLSVIILIQTMSCNSQISDLEGDTKDTNKKTILIYVLKNVNNTHQVINTAVNLYNKKYSDTEIRQEIYSADQQIEKFEDYYTKLSTQLSAGEGPDILIFEEARFVDTHISIPKILQSDVLYDLNNLIKDDETFKFSDYIKKILDSGIYKGKRYLIPIGFNIYTFSVKKDELERNGIVIDPAKWCWEYLEDLADEFRLKRKGDNSYLFFTVPEYLVYKWVQNSGISLIDYEKGKTRFDSTEFVNMLQSFKEKFYPTMVPSHVTGTWSYIIMDYSDLGDIEWYSTSSEIIDSTSGKIIDFYTIPAYKGENNIFLDPCYSVAVANKCKYKKEAFEFIKMLLSEEVQNSNKYFPVNKKSYVKNVSVRFKNIDVEGQGIEAQLEIIENIGRCEFFDNSVFQIIKKELNEYINGMKTAEQTAKTINDKVNLYLNE